jgi:ABC-2 type transport system permease protein
MTEADLRETALNSAPSEIRQEEPTLLRIFAILGLGLASLGLIAYIANQFSPRFVGPTAAIISMFIGVSILLLHAFRDSDFEFRRIYLVLGVITLIASLVVSIVPIAPEPKAPAELGYLFIPYGPTTALLGLLFIVASMRHEPNEKINHFVNLILLTVAFATILVPVVMGLYKPTLLAGPGLLIAIVGVIFSCAYLSRMGTTDGIGRLVGMGLGFIGGLTLIYALGRSFLTNMLYEGPQALKLANQQYDMTLLLSRVAMIALFCFCIYKALKQKHWSFLAKILICAGFGLFAFVFLITIFTAPISSKIHSFLVPGGLILALIGSAYLLVSMAYCSDSPFVALMMREVTSFFVSPIAYLVLIGSSFVSAIGYLMMIEGLTQRVPGQSVLEPIVGEYWSATIGAAFLVCVIVPAITMRLFSEEKRTGTLEVLLTSPVSEWQIVISKFLAAWFFYMIVWLPLGLFLLGLRAAGSPFEFRPLLSYYLAQAITGAALISMGLFFSALTRNQIVAAVMTFAGTFGLLLTLILKQISFGETFAVVRILANKLDFLNAWTMSLNGQLSFSFMCIYSSLAVVWLYLTIKVLEARRWA